MPEGTELSPINPHGEPERTGPDGKPWPLLDTVRPWDSLSADEQRLFVRMAEVFAGYISYYDDRIGRVLDYLEESGQLDNTIIVVISDNGASGEGGPNGSFNEWRFFNGVPERPSVTLPHIDELGTPASYNHYNTGWAWALDTPFPYWKRWAGEEGGVADMCFVSWPARSRPIRRPASSTSTRSTSSRRSTTCSASSRPRSIKGYPQQPDRRRELRRGAHRRRRARARRRSSTRCSASARSTTTAGSPARVHPPRRGWGNFDKDEWELYHLETDRSQSQERRGRPSRPARSR